MTIIAEDEGFDLGGTITYDTSTSTSNEETQPYGLTFNTDGSKMYLVGIIGNDVNEYALSTDFDISTAAFTHATSVAAQEGNPTAVAFSADGFKMFVIGLAGLNVNEYTLSVSFDVSTADYVDNNFVDRTNNLAQGINGIKTFSENVICSVASPTAINHLTRKDFLHHNKF